MSFTVKCDDCQTKEKFTEEIVGDGDFERGEKITILAENTCYGEPAVFSIECKVCKKII